MSDTPEQRNLSTFPLDRLEHINNIALPLGTMVYSELVALEEDARSRVVEAQTDAMIIQDYLARRFPGGAES